MEGSRADLIAELRSTLAKMEIALGGIADSIVWTDGRGAIQWCNASFDRLVGRAHIEILGGDLVDQLALEREGEAVPREEHPTTVLLEEYDEYMATLDFRSRDGRKATLEVVGTRIQPGVGERGAVLVLRDVTLRAHLLLEQLRRAEAEDRVRDREQFMLVAAHELRTPISAMKLHAELLKRLAEGKEAELVSVLERQVTRLAELIDTVLDVSRIAAGRIELTRKEMDLAALVQDVVATFRPALAKANCRVDLHAAQPVIGLWDRARIEQVVVNLMTNAMKYARLERPSR